MAMGVVMTVGGIALVVVGLHDIFRTLLRPTGLGGLSRLVLTGTWRISRATGHRLGSTVGPLAMVGVILLWVVLQLLGWALIYLPHVPDGFVYPSGVDPSDYRDFPEAMYLSAVTLTTLGYGDMVATDPWIRVASPLQALTGFALLTAALTWFTQIYPPLSRRRTLALELHGLAASDWAHTVDGGDPAVLTRVLDTLTAEVTQVRSDFAQHGEGYYFQEREPDLALARQLPYALVLRDKAQASAEPVVRRSGRQLARAIEQLASSLDDSFLHTHGEPEEVLAAYAADHGQDSPA